MRIDEVVICMVDSAGQRQTLTYNKKSGRWRNDLKPGLSQKELNLMTQVSEAVTEYEEEG